MNSGLLFSALAQTLWGIFPLYWKLLSSVHPIHVLASRIVFSFVFVTIALAAKKNTAWVKLVREKPLAMFLSGALISLNWGVFIFAVQTGKTVQASLGYYINPLVTILLGLLVLKEKLNAAQWVSVALAALGVAILSVFAGVFPWISLALALTFALYGLLKKTIQADALEGLGAETSVSLPIAAALLFLPPHGGAAYILNAPLPVIAGIVMAGPVTAVPLYLFAKGAKFLPLSVMGFAQFISPTLQFLVGVFFLGEKFPAHNLIPYSIIWVSAVLSTIAYTKKLALRKNLR